MMNNAFLLTFLSVSGVSLLSLLGAVTLFFNKPFLKKALIFMVSISAGAMFGDVFIHLLPEISKKSEFNLSISAAFIIGILISFIIERLVLWNNCHDHECTEKDKRAFTYMILYGDSVHNFIDGIVIASSYIISPAVGFASTLAVVLHEIPHEIGDFAVLIHGGFTHKKALIANFASALTALLGAVFAFTLSQYTQQFQVYLLAFAAANFIYIAGTDLIPELHKELDRKRAIIQIIFFILGVLLMLPLLLLEK
jgi:zinc and cadmium transporter